MLLQKIPSNKLLSVIIAIVSDTTNRQYYIPNLVECLGALIHQINSKAIEIIPVSFEKSP